MRLSQIRRRSDSIVYTDSYPAMSPRRLRVRSPQDRPLGRLTFSIATITSMESRTSGTRPSARSAVTTAFRKPTFPSFSRKLNFASTSGHPAPQTLGQTHGLANPIWDNPFPICSFTGTPGAHWRQILTNFQPMRVARLVTIGKQVFWRQCRERRCLSASPCRSSKRGYELPLSVCRFF